MAYTGILFSFIDHCNYFIVRAFVKNLCSNILQTLNFEMMYYKYFEMALCYEISPDCVVSRKSAI